MERERIKENVWKRVLEMVRGFRKDEEQLNERGQVKGK